MTVIFREEPLTVPKALEGTRVKLRAFVTEDALRVRECLRDARVALPVSAPVPYPDDRAQKWLESMPRYLAGGVRLPMRSRCHRESLNYLFGEFGLHRVEVHYMWGRRDV